MVKYMRVRRGRLGREGAIIEGDDQGIFGGVWRGGGSWVAGWPIAAESGPGIEWNWKLRRPFYNVHPVLSRLQCQVCNHEDDVSVLSSQNVLKKSTRQFARRGCCLFFGASFAFIMPRVLPSIYPQIVAMCWRKF